MFGDEPGGVRMIFQHAGKFQLRPAETEIHRGFFDGLDEFRQVIARAEPGENAVARPAPGNDFFAGEIRVKMPAMLLGIFFNALMQPVIIPAQSQQDALLFFAHRAATNKAHCSEFSSFSEGW